jgi:hypothetical protein
MVHFSNPPAVPVRVEPVGLEDGQIARTLVAGEHVVSTIERPARPFGTEPYEVQVLGDRWDCVAWSCERYPTKAEALLGHGRMVARVVAEVDRG